jgi:hypothetical protein
VEREEGCESVCRSRSGSGSRFSPTRGPAVIPRTYDCQLGSLDRGGRCSRPGYFGRSRADSRDEGLKPPDRLTPRFSSHAARLDRPPDPPSPSRLRTHRRVARWGKNRRTLAGFSLLLHRRRGLAFPRRSPFSTSRGRRARRSDAPLVARERGGSRAHARGRSRRAPARGARAGAGRRAPRADPAREKKSSPRPGRRGDVGGSRWRRARPRTCTSSSWTMTASRA